MEIKDKYGFVRVKFDNFEKYSELSVFVTFEVLITLNNFTAKRKLSAELSDFEYVLEYNSKMLEKLTQVFYFQHDDDYLKIKFEPIKNEGINIWGYVKDELYTNTLEFSFITTPIDMEIFNQQLGSVINALR
jgi:hypothetical protein